MSKVIPAINSAFLATKEKTEDRKLSVGKVVVDSSNNSLVFYLLETLSPWLPTNRVEKAIVDSLKKSVSGKPSFSTSEFEEVLKDINQEIENIANEKETDWIGNVNAIIGYVEGNKLHLSMFGNIDGYLIRDTKISKITEGLSDNNPIPSKLFSSVTSGGLIKNDKVIVSNLGLFDNISIEQSRRILSNLNAKESIKEFHSLLRKMRAHSVNIALFEITDVDNISFQDNDNEHYPEFLYLDQAQKTIWDEFKKKAGPVLHSTKTSLVKGGKKTGVALGVFAKQAHGKIKDSYVPKTKEIFQGSKQVVSEKLNKQKKTKDSKLKVRPYKKENTWFYSIRKTYSKAAILLSPMLKKIFSWLIDKKNRRFVYIGLVIILIFFVYFKITANNSNREEIKNEREMIIAVDEAKDLFNQAKEDMALMRDGGEEKLFLALEKAQFASDGANTENEANQLISEIQTKIDELTGAVRFSSLEPLFFVKDDVIVSELAGSTIYSITSEGKIYATDTREKTPTLVASIGEENGKALDASYSESVDKLFVYTTENKVLALDATTDTIEEATVSQEDNDWNKSVSVATYSSNVYTLDSESGEVWRHSKIDTGFTKGTDYLDTRKVSIAGAVDLAIDGTIYVLKSDSSVIKFVRGSWDSDFVLGTIPSPGSTIDEPTSIFSDSDSNFIYILDKKLNRILRFEKSGTYSNQFIFNDFSVEHFFVNPRLQTMWVISSGNVYEVGL